MIILYADEFSKQFFKLPKETQSVFRRQEIIFRKNWRDSRLHTKKLHGHSVLFSFRVTPITAYYFSLSPKIKCFLLRSATVKIYTAELIFLKELFLFRRFRLIS